MTIFSVSTAILLASSLVAGAEPPASSEPSDAEGYCAYSIGVADSEAALWLAPEVMGAVGLVPATDLSFGEGSVGTRHPRVLLGLRYSLSGLRRGLVRRERGRADCERYRVVSALRTFLQSNEKPASRAALQERLKVLDEALPQAEAILKSTEQRMNDGSTTAVELNATAIRIDTLRSLAAQTRQDLASLFEPATPPTQNVHELFASHLAHEEQLALADSRLRATHAWDVDVRGGYMRDLLADDRVPVFGMLTLSFNLGWLWQRPAEARAFEGRRAWVRKEGEGLTERVRQMLKAKRAALAAERVRLEETRILLADIEGRLAAVQDLRTERVARYRDYLWFDFVKVKADHAYYRANVADLEALVGSAPGERYGGR